MDYVIFAYGIDIKNVIYICIHITWSVKKNGEEFEASDSRLRKNSEAPSQVSSKKEKGRGLKKALKDTDDEYPPGN